MSGRSQVGGEYRRGGFTTWELDLWGRIRNLEDAALQSLAGFRRGPPGRPFGADRPGGRRLSWPARSTNAWRSPGKPSRPARESYRIFRRRVEVGSTSKLDLTQVQTLLNQAQALLTQLEQARTTQPHALALLVVALIPARCPPRHLR